MAGEGEMPVRCLKLCPSCTDYVLENLIAFPDSLSISESSQQDCDWRYSITSLWLDEELRELE